MLMESVTLFFRKTLPHHKKTYNIFSLKIRSALDLSSLFKPTLENTDFDIDIQLANKIVPEEAKRKIYYISENYSYFYKEGVAFFECFNGNCICVTILTDQESKIVKTLLTFPMAICFNQKGFLPLHASAVGINNRLCLFAGPSHAGKSTLAGYLVSNGATFISEDISMISTQRKICIVPGPSYISLSDDSSKLLGNQDEIVKNFKKEDRNLYKITSDNKEEFEEINCYFLKWGDKFSIDKIRETDSLEKILKFSFISESAFDLKKVQKFLAHTSFFNCTLEKKYSKLKDIKERFF